MDDTEFFIKQRRTFISVEPANAFDSNTRLASASMSAIPVNYNQTEHSLYTNDKEDRKMLSDKQQQTSESDASSPLSAENICWFIASVISIYFSDIFRVLLFDHRIYRSLMFGSFLLIGINIGIALYLIVYLTHIKKISSNKWTEKHPTLIPIATACFISGSILLTISIWPVYTWLTAPLLFTIFMGFIVVLINLPTGF